MNIEKETIYRGSYNRTSIQCDTSGLYIKTAYDDAILLHVTEWTEVEELALALQDLATQMRKDDEL